MNVGLKGTKKGERIPGMSVDPVIAVGRGRRTKETNVFNNDEDEVVKEEEEKKKEMKEMKKMEVKNVDFKPRVIKRNKRKD